MLFTQISIKFYNGGVALPLKLNVEVDNYSNAFLIEYSSHHFQSTVFGKLNFQCGSIGNAYIEENV